MKGAQMKVARAEKRALEQPTQQRRSTVPMQERAAAVGVELPAAPDTSTAGGSVGEKAAIRKHQWLVQKVALAEQQETFLIRLNSHF